MDPYLQTIVVVVAILAMLFAAGQFLLNLINTINKNGGGGKPL